MVQSFAKLKQGPDKDLSMLEERWDWQFIGCATTLVEYVIKFKKGCRHPSPWPSHEPLFSQNAFVFLGMRPLK